MEQLHSLFLENIIKNMSEGIMVIGFDGVIQYLNPSAVSILGLDKCNAVGEKFAKLFFENELNDAFAQAVLDSIYDRNKEHESIFKYYVSDDVKWLRVITSYLTEGDEKVGVIVVFSDLSELVELKDAVKSMEKIKSLNSQLEIRNKLISDTFGRFLSDDIVKHLLDTPEGLKLGGKKHIITILMSDLRGFTALSERMDASDLIAMLNHYLGEMTEAIQKYHGSIIEFLGDGIFAIFGAPLASEMHATEAVAAALEMQKKMNSINDWNKNKGYPTIEMGIGINTGEVILGNIGSEKRTKYGVVGKHVNLAGRIESYTVGGQILISPSTKALIKENLEILKTLRVNPKGANEELELSDITGLGSPFNIHLELSEEAFSKLINPVSIGFHLIKDKHEGAQTYYGRIIALSKDGAIIQPDIELELFTDIEFDAGGKLFCKIVEKKNDGYVLQFTSIPTGYSDWLKNIK